MPQKKPGLVPVCPCDHGGIVIMVVSRVQKGGKLPENILYFARALRDAGVKLGPSCVVDAVRAVEVAGLGGRDDLYWVLHCVFVRRKEDQAVFDEAFYLFWRSRDLVEKMIAMFSPKANPNREAQKPKAGQMRVAEALFQREEKQSPPIRPEIEIDASFSVSSREVLKEKDFAQMSAQEFAEAKLQIKNLELPIAHIQSRRFKPSRQGHIIDARAMMKKTMATNGDLILPQFKQPKMLEPPLVVLTDISGSMSQYSRIFLHFLHALNEKRQHMHVFLFGTRLTNITRALKAKDPDQALDDVARQVADWEGGTRIGETLASFNRLWGRRVLGQGACVLLMTDGLERAQNQADLLQLKKEMERLQKSCRRLIWLNPLLRYEGFEPRAAGVKIMLPFVDDFRSIHALNSLTDLCAALQDNSVRRLGQKFVFEKEK